MNTPSATTTDGPTQSSAQALVRAVASSGYAGSVLDRLAGQASGILDAEESCILVRDERDGESAIVCAGRGLDEDLIGTRVAAAPELGPTTSPGETRIAPDLMDMHRGLQARATVPISWSGSVQGALAAGTTQSGRKFSPDELRALLGLAEIAGAALVHARSRPALPARVRPRAEALAAAVDVRDGYTAKHSVAVLELTRTVGTVLGFKAADLLELELAALLHDLGKIGIPDAILKKPGPLLPDELNLMEHHPTWGAKLLAAIPGLEPVATIVRFHHEHWDGGGYPDGLKGHRIPIASRIIGCCDAYQAMTSERCYRTSLGREVALEELQAHAGSQFDPSVVQALSLAL